MNCNVVKDLIPLYIDGCCSEESAKIVEDHIKNCEACRIMMEEMNAPADMVSPSDAPKAFRKLNDWKASIMQSLLLFLSFSLITAGVALEARTPLGLLNGFWAFNLVIPATGFMLSLANWYFIKLYPSKRSFSNCSFAATLGIVLCACIWAVCHYEIDLFELLGGLDFPSYLERLQSILLLNGLGIILTVIFCILSKTLSGCYAAMLSKE